VEERSLGRGEGRVHSWRSMPMVWRTRTRLNRPDGLVAQPRVPAERGGPWRFGPRDTSRLRARPLLSTSVSWASGLLAIPCLQPLSQRFARGAGLLESPALGRAALLLAFGLLASLILGRLADQAALCYALQTRVMKWVSARMAPKRPDRAAPRSDHRCKIAGS